MGDMASCSLATRLIICVAFILSACLLATAVSHTAAKKPPGPTSAPPTASPPSNDAASSPVALLQALSFSSPLPPPPLLLPPPPPRLQLLSLSEQREPDYRLKWLGPTSARAVTVSGDWNDWSTTTGAFVMARADDGLFAADIFLPERCLRKNLIMAGVCCYRYKFYIDLGTRKRWQHDPRQPMDKDPDGWVNNFMCKYANGHDGKPMRTIPHASRAGGPLSGQPPLTSAAAAPFAAAEAAAAKRAAAAALARARRTGHALPPPPPPLEVCLVLPATYFNGSTLGTASTRGLGGCCDVCRRRAGCAAYNWRPEPLSRNCVLFGRVYGVPRGTALCSAGIVKVPLAPPPPPPPSLHHTADASGVGARRKRRQGGRRSKSATP